MEWRIFIPVVNDTSENLRRLFSELNQEISLFYSKFSLETEKRSDQYLISHTHFGIKFRAEKKLELKVRIQRNDYGIEAWRKYKLGKSSILDQLDPVCRVLKDSGFEHQLEDFRNRIVEGRAILVEKARKNFPLSDVLVEVCTLQVHSNQWISIAVEATKSEFIESFLFNGMTPIFRKLLEIIQYCTDNNISSFQPFICGYPQWIQHIDGHFPFSKAEWDEGTAPLSIFFGNLKN